MRIKKYWIFAFLLIILATSTNFISPREGKQPMNVRVSSKGIPEHGLSLIGPTDPSFETHLSTALGDTSAGISKNAKLLSTVIMNSSERVVVAYNIKWNLVDINGKTVSHERSYKDPSLLMGTRRPTGPNSESNSIKPESSRLISLVPTLTDTRSAEGSIGGLVLERVEPAENESVKRALMERNTDYLANKLANNLEQVVSVTVSLDGAFFDDGTFVGPDETQFFSKVKAQLDAKYDLHNRIKKMFSSGKPPEKVLQYINNFANMPRGHLGGDSSPSQFYDFFMRIYAQEISRIWGVSGHESVARFVETSTSAPWASLRKR